MVTGGRFAGAAGRLGWDGSWLRRRHSVARGRGPSVANASSSRRPDPGLDRGRHRPEGGRALGRRGPAVPRRAGRARQPPGGGDALARSSPSGRPACPSPTGPAPPGLPEGRADDPARRTMAGVPGEVVFRTEPGIALGQLRRAVTGAGHRPPGVVVVTDAACGNGAGSRDGVTALDLPRVVGTRGSTTSWAPGAAHQPPLAAEGLAMAPPAAAWRSITWREGDAGRSARASPPFGFVRRRIATPRGPNRIPRRGSSASGPRARPSRPRSPGSRPCPRRSRSRSWSRPPSCAGGSSATPRGSSGNSAPAIPRAAAGAASTAARPWASPPAAASPPSAAAFPLAGSLGPGCPDRPRAAGRAAARRAPPRAPRPRPHRHLAPPPRRRARALPAAPPLLLAPPSGQAYVRQLVTPW
jgi:DDE superfamily endonuclease